MDLGKPNQFSYVARKSSFFMKRWEILTWWIKYETSDCPFLNFVIFFINPEFCTGKPQKGSFARVTGFECIFSSNYPKKTVVLMKMPFCGLPVKNLLMMKKTTKFPNGQSDVRCYLHQLKIPHHFHEKLWFLCYIRKWIWLSKIQTNGSLCAECYEGDYF